MVERSSRQGYHITGQWTPLDITGHHLQACVLFDNSGHMLLVIINIIVNVIN